MQRVPALYPLLERNLNVFVGQHAESLSDSIRQQGLGTLFLQKRSQLLLYNIETCGEAEMLKVSYGEIAARLFGDGPERGHAGSCDLAGPCTVEDGISASGHNRIYVEMFGQMIDEMVDKWRDDKRCDLLECCLTGPSLYGIVLSWHRIQTADVQPVLTPR